VSARIGWKALTADEYVDEGFVFLSTPNIKGNEINFVDVNYITKFRFDESPDLKLQLGDVLLVKDGNTLGIANIVKQLPRPATVNGSIAVIRPFGIDPRYLRYVLVSNAVQDLIASLRSGMGVPHLFQWDINRIPLPLPDPSTQGAIADYLDTELTRIDALIDKKKQLAEVVSEYFVALLGATMGSLPSRRRLRQLAKLGTGHTPDRKKPEYWLDCTIPWVTAADISSRDDVFEPLLDTEQKVSEIGVANSAAVVHPRGTVMLCRTASIGLLCEIGVPMATTQAFVTWTPGPSLDSTFLLFALSSMAQEWKRLAFGSTHDTIYMPDLESVKIPFASLDEQKRIAARLKDASREVGKIRKKLNDQIGLLREYRQSLITAAVTGELDIRGVAA
jgi:type I restriction enzyme S subunit